MAIFIVEIAIALFVHDGVVRPYVGDILVVVLMYAAAKMLFPVKAAIAVTTVFMFAVVIEVLQAWHLVGLLRLQQNVLARTVLGTSFSWMDIAMYAIGSVLILAAEKARGFRRSEKK